MKVLALVLAGGEGRRLQPLTARIPEGFQVGIDPRADRELFTVTSDGVVVVEKNRILTEGSAVMA